MRRKSKFRRIAFLMNRTTELAREWFRGTMLYTRHNSEWFVRVFEASNWKSDSLIDLGEVPPDGLIVCDLPARYVRQYLKSRGWDDIPFIAFPQPRPCSYGGSVTLDSVGIARCAIDLFKQRGCQHVAYCGAHNPWKIRSSRAIGHAFASAAEQAGLVSHTLVRKVYESMGVCPCEANALFDWLRALPKPCGIFVYDDNIARDLLDMCRYTGINVPGSVYMLGLDNNKLVCENAIPSLSSIQLDYERTAFLAAKTLDDMIDGRLKVRPHLVCGVKKLVERASTQDPKGSGRLVALACEYINQNACREGGISQHDIANHLGVSVRTLQLRFKEASFSNTILNEIQRVQLENVCRLLTGSDLSISEITFASGFGSLSRLKAIFQKKYKMSMREYRNLKKLPPPPENVTI